MGKHPYRKWKCQRCKSTVKAKERPSKCQRCKIAGTMRFFGARLLTKEEARRC